MRRFFSPRPVSVVHTTSLVLGRSLTKRNGPASRLSTSFPRQKTTSTTWTSTSWTAARTGRSRKGDPGPEHVARVDGRRRAALEYADGLEHRIVRPAEDDLVASGSAGKRMRQRRVGGTIAGATSVSSTSRASRKRRGRTESVRPLARRPRSQLSADPFADAQKYRASRSAGGQNRCCGSYYGEPTGVVGFRLFTNPDFDENARRSGTRNASTTIPVTTIPPIWCVRTVSACRAPSVTWGPIQSGRRWTRKTRSGKT